MEHVIKVKANESTLSGGIQQQLLVRREGVI